MKEIAKGFGKRRNSRLTKMALFHFLVLVWPSQSTLCKQACIMRRNMGLEAEKTWHISTRISTLHCLSIDLIDWTPTNPITCWL